MAIPYQATSPRANRGIFEVNTYFEGKITAPIYCTVYVGYANYFDALIARIRSLPMLARNKSKTKLFNTITIIFVMILIRRLEILEIYLRASVASELKYTIFSFFKHTILQDPNILLVMQSRI